MQVMVSGSPKSAEAHVQRFVVILMPLCCFFSHSIAFMLACSFGGVVKAL